MTLTTNIDAEMLTKVERAAAFLDVKYGKGEWEPLINLRELAQSNAELCVAGQIGEHHGITESSWKVHGQEYARLIGEDPTDAAIDQGPFGAYSDSEWLKVLADRGFELESPVMVEGIVNMDRKASFDLVGDILTIIDGRDSTVVKIDLSKV